MRAPLDLRVVALCITLAGLLGTPGAGVGEPFLIPSEELLGPSVQSAAAIPVPGPPTPPPPGRGVVRRCWDGWSRYLDMIRQVFRKKGLPEDLAFTAMIESGFNPVAVSRAGAKGLWQFMGQTGRRYGVRGDRWGDEGVGPGK